MTQIIEKFIKYNYNQGRNGNKIKYIVIHDTGNKSKGSDSEAHFRYFNGENRNASAHYFVDEKQIIQTVNNLNTSWHVGDGKGKYGITNQNSIGIEICVNSDGNYEKALKNTIWLTKKLMNDYNINIENVVRHFDASRKNCPASMSLNNWSKWNEFKKALQNKETEKKDIITIDDAIKKLGNLKIISTSEYWYNAIKCINYLDTFIINSAKKCTNKLTGDFSVDSAIKKLVSQKIIESPEYWYNAIRYIKYLDILIINIAKSL